MDYRSAHVLSLTLVVFAFALLASLYSIDRRARLRRSSVAAR
jgi:hypothetical protein